VPGGGVALLRTLPVLAGVETSNKDEQIGVDVINRAIRYRYYKYLDQYFCKKILIFQKFEIMPMTTTGSV